MREVPVTVAMDSKVSGNATTEFEKLVNSLRQLTLPVQQKIEAAAQIKKRRRQFHQAATLKRIPQRHP